MGGFSALKYEPEPSFMRAFYAEVYQKLPLFDDQVSGLLRVTAVW
jgi:hypothetical protein